MGLNNRAPKEVFLFLPVGFVAYARRLCFKPPNSTGPRERSSLGGSFLSGDAIPQVGLDTDSAAKRSRPGAPSRRGHFERASEADASTGGFRGEVSSLSNQHSASELIGSAGAWASWTSAHFVHFNVQCSKPVFPLQHAAPPCCTTSQSPRTPRTER